MTFKCTSPDENFPILKLVSEGGRWELGLASIDNRRVIRLAQIERPWFCLFYTIEERHQELTRGIFWMVFDLLAHEDEATLSEDRIAALFPKWERLPADREPAHLVRMRELAAEARERMGQAAEVTLL